MELREVAVKQRQDTDPDLSWLEPDSGNYKGEPAADIEKYERQDAERLEAYHRDEWTMIGVYAEAEISAAGVIEVISSGGLWGIESDSDGEYLADVGREQLEELAKMLEELGATPEQLEEVRATAPAPVEYV